MREIKFRGYSKRLKTWLYGSLIYANKKYYILPNSNNKKVIEVKKINNFLLIQAKEKDRLVAPESVGQFTGLKDKNGKEIYEGDIVECVSCKEKDRKYKVAWCDKFLGFILEHKKEKYQISIFNDFKIIGNVFENPELLEQEK